MALETSKTTHENKPWKIYDDNTIYLTIWSNKFFYFESCLCVFFQ